MSHGPIAIFVCGTTVPPVKERRGDFADWFRSGLGLDPAGVLVVDVEGGEALPAVEQLSGCVVTGSSAMVTDGLAWSLAMERWLTAAHGRGLPILGVCYGHQALARALGGAADWNPAGREVGAVALDLLEAAEDDALLGDFSGPLIAQESHSQSVTELPPGAILLARSELDPHQAFRVGASTWGLQFHPEFDADITRGYLEHRRESIEAEGIDVGALLERLRDDDRATQILARFRAVALGRDLGANQAQGAH
ncbi:glutamine amidotransferase [Engelhardtia mirabilis]|uniref:GMP synthase [glutamine-hydrolyzing] n=1 Tax=Engelhardtia mirabilis TaxID=2528011 RepID=A0A518BNK0_9BACT|nr:GMP synthase [glutamine-hydrolyzing] [Planctomycetes bacterium Pla133]QDV02885.1 GMP synthase [glutamine-hydrolyzing] [Planctomycetes bacterium Pla86]